MFEMLLRVGAAMLAGLIVGIERESHGRAAGMRTTMLVCVAACLAMLISEALFAQVALDAVTGSRPDPARLAQGVLSGMGFLGAGSILRQGNRVQGITTAAILWYVSILGLAFGAGMFVIGGLGMLLAALILFVFPAFERRVKEDWYATISADIAMDGISDTELKQRVEAQGLRVKRTGLRYDVAAQMRHITFEVKFKKDHVFEMAEQAMAKLSVLPGIQRIGWE